MEKTKRICIYNNKGGVAKTTSVINIAYCLNKKGQKVLVVDCDTQENCFDFFFSTSADSIFKTEFDNISHTTWSRFEKLSDKEISAFDIVLFDLPPTLSEEVQRILHQSDKVYVPSLLGRFEITGITKVTEEIHRQNVKLGGVFVTMYDDKSDAKLLEMFRAKLGNRLMQTVIPYSKTIRESLKAGLPIEAYFIERKVPHVQSSWKIVNAYESLAAEIMEG